jgi:CDP-glycerol glycerophosphotransferase (TagB/SpsB family)
MKIFKTILFFIISLIIKTNKKMLVFGDRAGKKFSDNSRYLFIYLNEFEKDFVCIWLTNDKKILQNVKNLGYRAYLSKSISGSYYALRAYWHIYNYSENDTHEYAAKFRNTINLFHGTAVKKVTKKYLHNFYAKNLLNKILTKINFQKNKFKKSYLVYANNKKNYIPWTSWSGFFPPWKFNGTIVSNLQRNIMLYNYLNINLDIFRTKKEQLLFKKLLNTDKKIIGYFPTFRVGYSDLFIDVKNLESLNQLNQDLKKNNSIMLIKKHMTGYSEDKNKFYDNTFDKFEYLKKFENFYTIDYDIDLTSILSLCDLVISDYSSLILDFLFINKPIILYIPDYKKYSQNPGIALNIKKEKFFFIANNFFELNELLSQYKLQPNEFLNKHTKERLIMKKKIFEDYSCFENIIKIIK